MRKRSTALIISAAFILSGCGAVRGEISEEKTTAAQFTATTEKAPEIATGRPTEAETEAKTEPDTEKKTEKPDPGDINVKGYGWVFLQYSAPYHIMEGHLTRENGSIRCFGHHETWYSTNEGCGQTTAVPIPGKHVADDGTIRDEDGYICVASSDLKMYSIVMTSVGPGKVYDCGCSSGTIDVYTNW